MHRCDNADSKGTAINAGGVSVSVYRDEQSGSHAATQLRHTELNAIQEEISNVILSAGISLHTDSETPAQMNQLELAVDTLVNNRVSDEALARANAIAVEANARAVADSNLQAVTSRVLLSGTIGCRLMSYDVTVEQTGVLKWQRNGRQIILKFPSLSWLSNSTTLRLLPLSGQAFPNEIMMAALEFTFAPVSSVTDRVYQGTSGEYPAMVRLPMYANAFFDFYSLRTPTGDFLATGGAKGISANFITYFVDHD